MDVPLCHSDRFFISLSGLHSTERLSPKEELSDDKIMKEIDSFVNDDNEHLPLEVQLRRLLELQDRVMVLHHPVAKVKRQKMLKIEITKVRRKLSLDKSSQKGWFHNFFSHFKISLYFFQIFFPSIVILRRNFTA